MVFLLYSSGRSVLLQEEEMSDVNHHAHHFDEYGAPASESVCHTHGRYSEEEVKRLNTASYCYELLAERLPQDPNQELEVGFGNHMLRAHFSSGQWPRVLVSYDGIFTSLGKLSMAELELIAQAVKILG